MSLPDAVIPLTGNEYVAMEQGGDLVRCPLSDFFVWFLSQGPIDITGGNLTVSGGECRVTGGDLKVSGGSAEITGGGCIVSGGAITSPGYDPHVIGDGISIGSWRIAVEGDNALVQRLEQGVGILEWVTKHTFSA